MSKKKNPSTGAASTGHSTSDGPEPTASKAAVPVTLLALLVLLLYGCDVYLMGNSGDFSSQVYHPYASVKDLENAHPADPAKAQANKGKIVYKTYCVACHQENGQGAAGQFPPLAGSEWVLAEGPNRIIRVVLHGAVGPITVKGNLFNNNMLAWGPSLDDEQIAAVLTYVRSEWGNKAGAVKPEQVKKIRSQLADRANYWTEPELQACAEKE